MKKLVLLIALFACTLAALPVHTTLAASDRLSNTAARARVYNDGMRVVSSGNNCQNRLQRNCTSLEQVRRRTIDGIIALHHASHCAITITGGTEMGHGAGTYSHWNGYKLDVAKTTCVNNWIYRNLKYIGQRIDGAPLYRSQSGNIYANEYWANHWDITFFW